MHPYWGWSSWVDAQPQSHTGQAVSPLKATPGSQMEKENFGKSRFTILDAQVLWPAVVEAGRSSCLGGGPRDCSPPRKGPRVARERARGECRARWPERHWTHTEEPNVTMGASVELNGATRQHSFLDVIMVFGLF